MTGIKRREDGNTENWISQEQKQLFRWNKTSFIVFEGLSFGEKYLTLVSAIFYQIFFFSSNDRPSKTMKNIYFI